MSKSPSLRRIQADIRELALDPSDQYHASPLENDMFEWHFTIRGAEGTDFEGGVYHGRILLPPDYPFKPPHIMFLTPSGRFETNTKVCLSFSAYHPELWQPAWGIRLILEALISFLPTPADGAIGALDWSSSERKRLATKSRDWCCPHCGKSVNLIPKKKKGDDASALSSSPPKPSRFAKEIQELQRLQMQEHRNDEYSSQTKDDNKPAMEEEKQEGEKDETMVHDGKEQDVSTSEEAPALAEESKGVWDKPSADPVVVEQEDNIPNVAPVSTSADTENAVPAVATAAVEQPIAVVPVANTSKWVDPLLQLIIGVLSAICFILLRKVQDLQADLQALENTSKE